MNLNFNPALANLNNPFNNINRHPIARPLNLQDVAYALAEIKDGVARIENQLPEGHPIARPHPIPMFTNVTGQVHPQIGPERQQLHLNFHNLLRNLHPTAAQPKPQARRMRNANRNSNPCHACQVRKKRCSRMNGSPNVCERCHLAGLPACHPPPVRFTQDHVDEVYHEANNLGQWTVDHAKFMPSAQAPTTSSSIINNSDTKERPGNMMYDGNGNTQGLSCAAQLGQPTVKKEDSNWDEGVLIPSGQTLPYGSFEP